MIRSLVKKYGIELFTVVIAALALFGSLLYSMAAIFEFGRLSYYGAPTGFIQLGSIGVFDVALNAWPTMAVVFFMLLNLLLGVWVKSSIKSVPLFALANFVVTLVGVGYTSSVIAWRVYVAVTVLGLLLFFLWWHSKGGDEGEKSSIDIAIKIASVVLAFVVWLVIVYSAGIKSAEEQRKYWVVGNQVVLGFYGDNVLTTTLLGNSFGDVFKIQKIDSFSAGGLVTKSFASVLVNHK